MIFRILILFALVILAGCDQKTDKTTSKATVAGPVSITTYSVFDSTLMERVFEEEKRDWKDPFKRDSLKKYLSYKVCFSDVDGFMVRHPCSIDSAVLVSVVKKLNHVDTLRGIKVQLDFIYYSARIEDICNKGRGDTLALYNGFSDYSPIYLNDDLSFESTCETIDGEKCRNLIARIRLSKKFYPEDYRIEDSLRWTKEMFNIHIDERLFPEKFEIDSLYASVQDFNFYRNLKCLSEDPREKEKSQKRRRRLKAELEQLKKELEQSTADLETIKTDSLKIDSVKANSIKADSVKKTEIPVIPFDMCYENGYAIPCNLSAKELSFVRETVKKNGDTLFALTFQEAYSYYDFKMDAMSSRHVCKSSDGTSCDKLYVCVMFGQEHREDIINKAMETLEDGRIFEIPEMYIFNMKDLSYEYASMNHTDFMFGGDKNALYKKDGSFLLHVKNLGWW